MFMSYGYIKELGIGGQYPFAYNYFYGSLVSYNQAIMMAFPLQIVYSGTWYSL